MPSSSLVVSSTSTASTGTSSSSRVIDLVAFAKLAHENLAPARDGDDVACLQHGIGRDGTMAVAAADAFDEDALTVQHPLGLRDGEPTALPSSWTR